MNMVYSFSLEHISSEGVAPDWQNFNPNGWGLFLGTAVYAFEGIGLVLPIYDAMDTSVQHRFPVVLSRSILFLVTLFCTFASVVYLSFGSKTQAVVTLNLPSEGINPGKISVQVAYSIALILTYPLMMYPAMMVLENFFVSSRAPRPFVKGAHKWRKNAFRCLLVCATATISILCMEQVKGLCLFLSIL